MFDKITKNKKYVFIAILALMILGGILRWQHAGRYTFWIDELFHVHAAQSILETGKPFLPSGYLYTRALPYTYAVAASFNLFGVSEESARLPSILFALLAIPMIYLLGRELLSPLTGLIAASILTIHSYHIVWSVQGRMYSLSQLLYIILLLAVIRVFKFVSNNFLKFIYWSVIAGSIFLLALKIHSLTLFFLPAIFTQILILCLLKDVKRNRLFSAKMLFIKYGSVFFALVVIVFIDSIFGGNIFIGRFAELRDSIPLWGIESANYLCYYRWFLQKEFAVFYCVFPFALVLLIKRNTFAGIFLGVHFIVPIIFLSIASWKSTRYSFLILPVFFIISAFIIKEAIGIFHLKLKNYENQGNSNINKYALIIAFYLSVLSVLISPRIHLSEKNFSGFPKQKFQNKIAIFKNKIKDVAIISLEPLFFEFYFKTQPDYIMQCYGSIKDGRMIKTTSLEKQYDELHASSSNYRIVKSIKDIKEIERQQGQIFIIGEKYLLSGDYIGKEMSEYVLSNYKSIEDFDGCFDLYSK